MMPLLRFNSPAIADNSLDGWGVCLQVQVNGKWFLGNEVYNKINIDFLVKTDIINCGVGEEKRVKSS